MKSEFALLALLLLVLAGCLDAYTKPPEARGHYNTELESAPFSVLPKDGYSQRRELGSAAEHAGRADSAGAAENRQEKQAQEYRIDSALAKNSTSFYYDEMIIVNGMEFGDARVYVSGNKTRRESTGGWGETQAKIVTLIDSEKGEIYFYSPSTGTASRLREKNSKTYASGQPLQGKETYVGVREIFGVDADVFEYSGTPSGEVVRAWVWKEKGVILRTEVESEFGNAVVEARGLAFAELPESLFTLPENTVIEDVSSPPAN